MLKKNLILLTLGRPEISTKNIHIISSLARLDSPPTFGAILHFILFCNNIMNLLIIVINAEFINS